ncbi:MAG: DUF5041 domain-containing protein [Bacteroidaceae bacterium]|nr:DUF5041 domain-containing protein [Bacteroidaceae bacterium]
MNKKTIITFMLALVWVAGRAQEIGRAEATATDYIKLLNKQGYHVLALDLSKLEKDKYLLSPVIQIWSKGKMEQNLLEDFGIAYTNSAPKVTVGLMPKTDSLFTCNFQFDDVCGFTWNLPMPSVKNEDDGSEYTHYVCRPFVVQSEWKENEVIPVAAYSSSWYDPEDKICRNCDDLEFDRDFLKSATFHYSPCIYVFGITIKKM